MRLDYTHDEGPELKKEHFNVHIVNTEGRGKERNKMKHKHKTMLIDKGNVAHAYLVDCSLLLTANKKSHSSCWSTYGGSRKRAS